MILDPRQIGILIYECGTWGPGGSDARVVKFMDTAIAVAYGESGWNTRAKNASGATGLWQIMPELHAAKVVQANAFFRDDIWSEDEIKLGFGKNWVDKDLFDPLVNTKVANLIYDEAEAAGRDPWSPWEAYNKKTAKFRAGLGHGADVYGYLSVTLEHEKAVALAELMGSVIPGGVLIGAGSNVLETAQDWGDWIKANLVNAAYFILAVALLILGIVVIVSGTKAGKLAGNIIPAKRALKLVT